MVSPFLLALRATSWLPYGQPSAMPEYIYCGVQPRADKVGVSAPTTSSKRVMPSINRQPAEDPSRPLWGSALQDWNLSTEQLDELAALVAMVPSRKLPDCQKEDIDKARYQYIAQKAAEIKRRNEEKKIRSRFSYLRKLIQEDIESRQQEVSQATQAASRGTQAFRNFTERKNNNYMDKILKQYSQT